ncbi:unnamed protein product [Candida verbasci]|uniref:RGS domain-containing protein n=1 Tax=Candida verbasci TaxID=1227364 RepID=A0A9W4TXC2_9ASCO|nr:unnamed protein product [Candida verbasci]
MGNEKYQVEYPNSKYLSNLNNLNQTNQSVSLNRLPTLGEILSNKSKTPVDLFTFYQFMKDVENKVDYLDFWFDLINHLNLCKHYVKGLRDSIIRQSSTFHKESPNLRNSNVSSDKHKSLSSSILLDLIINDNILDENDSHRLSAFLRGDINLDNLDPKLKDLIEQYNAETEGKRTSQSPNLGRSSPSFLNKNRVSSNSNLLDHQDSSDSLYENQLDIGTADRAVSASKYVSLQSGDYIQPNKPFSDKVTPPQQHDFDKRHSTINPSLLERLIMDSPANSTGNRSFITRDNLRESSHNLLLKYFVDDSEKNLNLPLILNSYIIKSIEVDGRDDPSIFNYVKNYVFNKLENDHLPKFLDFMATRNINHSNYFRIIIGFFFLFIGFWISFIFIFLNYRKGLRPVIIIPFLIGFYLIISSIYLIDPILAWFGLVETFSTSENTSLIRIRERFIYNFILKRSIWVLFLILLFTAILTIVFSLVPGHRL